MDDVQGPGARQRGGRHAAPARRHGPRPQGRKDPRHRLRLSGRAGNAGQRHPQRSRAAIHSRQGDGRAAGELPAAVAAGGDDGRRWRTARRVTRASAGSKPSSSAGTRPEHQSPAGIASATPSGQAVRLSWPHKRCCWHRDPRANCRRSRHGMFGLQRLRPGRVQTRHREHRPTRARRRPPGCRWPASRASPSGSYSAAWRGCSNLRGE